MRIYTVSSKRLFDMNRFSYFFRYVLGVSKKRDQLDPAILFGAFMHKFLDVLALPQYTLPTQSPIVLDWSTYSPTWVNLAWSYYEHFVERRDEQIVLSEFPFVLQANSLCNYAGLENQFEDNIYFAGVMDALLFREGKFIVKDYKTYRVVKPYENNPLYDLDQLGMYCVAVEILFGLKPEAEVERIQANYLDYPTKEADDDPPNVVNYVVKNKNKRKKKEVVKDVVNYVVKSKKTRHGSARAGAPSPSGSFTFLASSGRYRKGSIDITHYTFSPSELRSTVRDFIAYIHAAEELIHSPNLPYFPATRYNGLEDDYYDLALAIRREEPLEPILEKYVKYPTNEEVSRAVLTWKDRVTCLDSRRCPVVKEAIASLAEAERLIEKGENIYA